MDGDSDESEYLSSCNVCFTNFDLYQFRPKVLPCSHTFCFRCLQAIHTENTLSCPLCRQEIELSDVASLPNNVYAQHIIHLNQKLMGAVQRDMSMHWCFVCDTVVKSSCKKSQHLVWDASRFAKELRFKMRQSKSNLKLALDKRQQMKNSLQSMLTIHKRQINDIQKRIEDNDLETNQLQAVFDTEPDLNMDNRKVSKRFQETNKILASCTDLANESQGQLDAFLALNTSDEPSGYSWKQKAHLIRSSFGKNYINLRETQRSCLTDRGHSVMDKITSVAFHPVKPILACGFQSGTIGFFVGKSNSSPFSSWTPSVWKFDDYSITSMEWNAFGNELACGNKESRIAVLNIETQTIMDLGYVGRHNRIRNVRWNRRWAPDLLAVSSKKDVHVWDVAKPDKKPVHVFKSIHHGHVECLIWLSADKIATCSNGGHIKISQLGNSQPLYEMKSAKGEIFSGLCWNVNSCKLATCGFSSRHVMWWVIDDIYAEDPTSDANSEDEDLQTHLIGNYEVICIDWYPALTNDETNEAELANPNQEILACGTMENLVIIVDSHKKSSVRRLVGHSGVVHCVAFSPDGKYLASLSFGKELIIWLSEDDYRKLTFYDLPVLHQIRDSLETRHSAIAWGSSSLTLTLFNSSLDDSDQIKVFEISTPSES